MKEQLYTIPLNDAMNAQDECPFCFIERNIEQDLLDFVLGSGSSYMEADIREMTDKAGFCRTHFKKMFDYGNTLGNAWILKTHYRRMIDQMQKQFASFTPGKSSFLPRFHKPSESGNAIGTWIAQQEDSCYICNQFRDTYARYLDTFFHLYKQDPAFREKVEKSKGFCLPHFKDLCLGADKKLPDKDREAFYKTCLPLMLQNMERIYGDVSWLIEKFDYRNKDADWKNSKDAIQRGMQKLKGGYPADGPYRSQK